MTQKTLRVTLFTAFWLGACVEAPPSSVANNQPTANNQTNNQPTTNNQTNNSTNSESNNLEDPTPVEFEPFAVSDGLVLHFLFEQPLPEPLTVANLATGFPSGQLKIHEEMTIQNGRLALNRKKAFVPLPEQVLQEAVNSGEFSVEIWWEHTGSDSGTLLKLSDSIRIIRRSDRIVIRLGDDGFDLRGVDLEPMSHLVLTSDADSMKLYVDGFLVWGRAKATEALNVLSPALELGSDDGAYIDIQQFAFYTRVLTQAEIAMHTMLGPGNSTRRPAREDTFALAFRDSQTQNNVLKRVVQKSIREPEGSVDKLDFSPEGDVAVPLLLLNHDLSELPADAERLHGYVRVETTNLSAADAESPFQIRAFQLLKLWEPQTVAWDSPWTEAGPKGEEDRAAMPFYESDLFTLGEEVKTERFLIETTGLLDSWVLGENYGISLDAEEIGRGEFSDAPHLRPGFMILGIGTPSEMSFPKVKVSAGTMDSCFVEHSATLPATLAFEVWQERKLVAVSSGNLIQVEDCTDPTTIEVSGLDAFGKTHWNLDVSRD